jgi:hypothetical protein
MKYLVFIFLFFQFASADVIIYDYQNKKVVLDSKKISSKNRIESKLLNGPYDIFIIGKKNNLNNSLKKSKKSEKIEKGKKLKIADEKIVYFTKINDEFLIYDSDKYKIPEKYLYQKKDFILIPKISGFTEKSIEFQIYKKFDILKSLNFFNNFYDENKWYYTKVLNKASPILLIQKLLDQKMEHNPIFQVSNLDVNKIREINLRLEIEYNDSSKKILSKNTHSLNIATSFDDWFIVNDQIYISIFNVLKKKYQGYEYNIKSITFKEVYIHLIGQEISNELVNPINLAILNLGKKISFQNEVLIYTEEILDNLADKSLNIDTLQQKIQIKETLAKTLKVKINNEEKEYILSPKDTMKSNIKIKLGTYENISFEDIKILNYQYLYKHFGEVFLMLKNENLSDNTKFLDKTKSDNIVLKNKVENNLIKIIFALIKTFYPVVIIFLIIGYLYFLKKLVSDISKHRLRLNIISTFTITIFALLSYFKVLNFQISIWILGLLTISYLTFYFKNPIQNLIKVILILIFLIFLLFMLGFPIMSALISYLVLIFILVLMAEILNNIKNIKTTSN